MPAACSPMGVATLTRRSGSGRALDVDDPSVPAPDPTAKDLDTLARRIRERHPDISLATVTALVEQAHAELAGAKVQSFRMILTERAVRRRLVPSTRQA